MNVRTQNYSHFRNDLHGTPGVTAWDPNISISSSAHLFIYDVVDKDFDQNQIFLNRMENDGKNLKGKN